MIKPFLKYPGGKSKLLPIIETLLPQNITHYVDPFLGGGSTFLRFMELHKDDSKKIQYDVNDLNDCVPHAFFCIQQGNDAVTERLKVLAQNNSKEHYYKVRDRFNTTEMYDLFDLTADFIYLNRTCFNGLYRVNQKDEFNVPYGHYKNPDILITDVREKVSDILKENSVSFSFMDFEKFLDRLTLTEKSFVYLDPPYEPLFDTPSFTAYTKRGFQRQDQERVCDLCHKLNDKGVKFLLHNSNAKFIRDAYSKFNQTSVEVPRSIARHARYSVNELIIRNYL